MEKYSFCSLKLRLFNVAAINSGYVRTKECRLRNPLEAMRKKRLWPKLRRQLSRRLPQRTEEKHENLASTADMKVKIRIPVLPDATEREFS
jgi:hypothetical protein